MYYVSTRNKTLQYTAAQAIAQGLSREGGLFTPAVLPRLPSSVLSDMTEMSYQQRAVYVLNCFLEDFGITEQQAQSIVYVTATGKKYHKSSTCGAGTYFESTLQQALEQGLTACDKCW